MKINHFKLAIQKYLKERLRYYYEHNMYLINGGDEDTSKGFLIPIDKILTNETSNSKRLIFKVRQRTFLFFCNVEVDHFHLERGFPIKVIFFYGENNV